MPNTNQKYVFKYRNADPHNLLPNGDRYLCEILNTDEEQLASKLYLPDSEEEKRGYCIGVVVNVGNGHRLDSPDTYVSIAEKYQNDPAFDPDSEPNDTHEVKVAKAQARQQRRMAIMKTSNIVAIGDDSMVARYPASVPMFFGPGEVVAIERFSGRPVYMRGREFRWINQVDVLGSYGIYLQLDTDGETWVERDLENEKAKRAEMMVERPNIKRLITP